MKSKIRLYSRLILGLMLYSIGIVATVKAELGLSPWDAFHIGISLKIGWTMGQVSIVIGILLIILSIFMREPFGIGTVVNVLLIGIFVDFIFKYELIKTYDSYIHSGFLILFGMGAISLATILYVGAGMGAGPRDGLMFTLVRFTNLSIGVSRTIVEVTVAIIGFILGAPLGIGTIIIFLLIGPMMGFFFDQFSFDPSKTEHNTFVLGEKK